MRQEQVDSCAVGAGAVGSASAACAADQAQPREAEAWQAARATLEMSSFQSFDAERMKASLPEEYFVSLSRPTEHALALPRCELIGCCAGRAAAASAVGGDRRPERCAAAPRPDVGGPQRQVAAGPAGLRQAQAAASRNR